MRTLNTAAITYSTSLWRISTELNGSLQAYIAAGGTASSGLSDLIDSSAGQRAKSGYSFTYTEGSKDNSGNVLNYSITGSPTSPGTTGQRYFYTDQTGVIRANSAGPATATSVPLG